jgi:uncharacterized protein (DUF1684 family)
MDTHLVSAAGSAALALALAAAACSGAPANRPAESAFPDYAAVVQAWRDKHEQDYRREYVTIAGLHFLEPGTATVGSGPDNDIVLSAHVPSRIGRFSLADGLVRYEPEPGLAVEFGGKTVTEPVVLKEPGKPSSGELVIGDVRLVVHQSGERLSIRVRDPGGELATGFKGYRWFAIDPAWRVTARFVPDAQPRQLSILNTFNDVTTYTSEGVVEFQIQGRTLRLRPFTTRPKRFYFVFRDASSGEETYGTGRFLYADLLDDGTTVLDFNEAYNPPCSFNPYTTCPIPLKENHLPVKILAGEMDYAGEVKLPQAK